MTRSETFRGPRRPSRAGRRAAGPIKVRLLLEQLEDRLPPGDAFLTALLALPAAGPVLAVKAVPPGPARRLATAVGLAAPDAFVPHASLADASLILVNPFAPTRRDAPSTDHDEPAFAATPLRPAPAAGIPEAGPLSVGPISAVPAPAGPASASPNVFISPPPANYQLDQAAAAVVAPGSDPDDLPPAALDAGPGVQSSGVRALFNLSHPTTGPFPSNVFTVSDRTQNTDRRVNLPFPDCKVYVSDCEDVAVLNELDGFNLQPRLSVPFSGPIDVNSVTSSTVFLVSLGSTVPGQGYMPRGTVVGINQIVWDVETNALHVESDELLAQHTRFALIVTNGIHDADGDRVEATREFRRFRQTAPREYRRELLDAIQVARRLGVRERDIVTASVFTTQSATAVLEKIRDQIHAATPEPADFLLGEKGERTVFPLMDETTIVWRQHTGFDAGGEPIFNPVNLNVSWLRDNFPPRTVGRLAFGKYVSPNYLTPEVFIPPVGTRTGTPAIHGWDEVNFNLVLPFGSPPPGGWPVAMVAHGSNANKNVFILRLAASNAARGIATVAINKVGNGFGPLGTLTVSRTADPPLAFPDGGRSRDMDGDGAIGLREGENALPPRQIVRDSDGYRQTVADLMQLVRVIEVGVDVDGDGGHDLDPSRIYFFGTSAGGYYGTPFLAVEPSVRVGALNVTGGSVTDGRRLSAPEDNRAALGRSLAARVPPLLNSPGVTELEGVTVPAPHFNENRPLRNGTPLSVLLADGTIQVIQAPVVNTTPGAMAIQEVMENSEWVTLAGDPLAYAPHLRKAPLPGVPTKSVLVAFARGDQGVPNPGTTALLRAGDLADRTSFYRHDLAYGERPTLPKNPHTYYPSAVDNPTWRDISLGAQSQTATFFLSDGKEIIHPEPARFFEVPIQGPLPEDLNFIP